MSRKISVKFALKSSRAIFCALLLSATLLSLTGCVRTAGKEAAAERNERDQKNISGRIAPELVGKWHKIPQGGFGDYARYAENLGNFEFYEISENGHVRRQTLHAAKNYDCLVELSTRSEGKVAQTSDSQLKISFDKETIQQKDACRAEKNYTLSNAATAADYQWRVGTGEDGSTRLCLTQPDGETACYAREE